MFIHRYGLVNSCVSLIALLSYMKLYPGNSLTEFLSPGLDLMLSFVPCLLNYVLVIPATTHYMYELREAKKSNDKELIKGKGMRFGLLHSLSLLLNFIPMCANVHFLYVMTSSAYATASSWTTTFVSFIYLAIGQYVNITFVKT